jgi:hypothetical protein
MPEEINPKHYQKSIETFDAITSQLSQEEVIGLLRGHILKYMMRFGSKHDNTFDAMITDAGKAEWYLNKLIQFLNDNKDKLDVEKT